MHENTMKWESTNACDGKTPELTRNRGANVPDEDQQVRVHVEKSRQPRRKQQRLPIGALQARRQHLLGIPGGGRPIDTPRQPPPKHTLEVKAEASAALHGSGHHGAARVVRLFASGGKACCNAVLVRRACPQCLEARGRVYGDVGPHRDATGLKPGKVRPGRGTVG